MGVCNATGDSFWSLAPIGYTLRGSARVRRTLVLIVAWRLQRREGMAAEAVAIYEELFETFKGRLSSDPKWTESRMHELMDATFDEVRGLNLPGVSTSDEVIVRASTALSQLMADAVLQTIAVYLARRS